MNGIKDALELLTLGTYIIGVNNQGKNNVMTAAWVSQVSSNPPLISVAVSKRHYTTELLRASHSFSLSILSENQKEIALRCGTVSGRDVDKLERENIKKCEFGNPIIEGAAGYISCVITDSFEVGDHVLFIGEVKDGIVLSDSGLRYKKSEFF